MTRLARVSAHGWKYPKAYQEEGRYMKNKKNILRIGTLITILMFLLIPLLSTQVAATFTYFCQASTDNKTTGPTCQTICPGPWDFVHGPGDTPLAIFCVNITFLDSNPTGSGSNHMVDITVTPPGAPLGYNTTTYVFLNPGQGPITTKLYVNLTYSPPTSWDVLVEAWCFDVNLGAGQTAYASTIVTVSVQ